jgi:hypothetical protein
MALLQEVVDIAKELLLRMLPLLELVQADEDSSSKRGSQ